MPANQARSLVCRRFHIHALHQPLITTPPPSAATTALGQNALHLLARSLSTPIPGSVPGPSPSLTFRASTAAPRPTSAFTASTLPLPEAQCKGVHSCGGSSASGAARRAARAMRRWGETGTLGGPTGHVIRWCCPPTLPAHPAQATHRAAALRGARQYTPTRPRTHVLCAPSMQAAASVAGRVPSARA